MPVRWLIEEVRRGELVLVWNEVVVGRMRGLLGADESAEAAAAAFEMRPRPAVAAVAS